MLHKHTRKVRPPGCRQKTVFTKDEGQGDVEMEGRVNMQYYSKLSLKL